MSHVIGWAKTKELVNTGFFGWFFFGECNMYYFMLILVPIWPHSVFVINIKGGLVLSLTIDKVMCALLGLHKHKSQLFFKNSRAVFTRSVCNQNSCREIKKFFFLILTTSTNTPTINGCIICERISTLGDHLHRMNTN